MSYTLVIIDMQAQFKASKKVIDRVLIEIEVAKENKAGIIILEYGGYGPTNPRILKAAYENYTRVFRSAKGQDDGSREIANIIQVHSDRRSRKRRLFSKNLRICGVNTDACVQRTVESLIRNYCIETVSIIEDACWTSTQPKCKILGKTLTAKDCHAMAIGYMSELGVNIYRSRAA